MADPPDIAGYIKTVNLNSYNQQNQQHGKMRIFEVQTTLANLHYPDNVRVRASAHILYCLINCMPANIITNQ
jgi:hypothetical protein